MVWACDLVRLSLTVAFPCAILAHLRWERLIDQAERPEAAATDQANRPLRQRLHPAHSTSLKPRTAKGVLQNSLCLGLRALGGGGKTLPFGSGFLKSTKRSNCEAKRYSRVFSKVKTGSSLPCLGSS